MDAEDVAQEGPPDHVLDPVEEVVRAGELSALGDVRVQPQAFEVVGRRRAREAGDFGVAEAVEHGEPGGVDLLAAAAGDVDVGLLGDLGRSGTPMGRPSFPRPSIWPLTEVSGFKVPSSLRSSPKRIVIRVSPGALSRRRAQRAKLRPRS